MNGGPAKSPLFPYTTLFRSEGAPVDDPLAVEDAVVHGLEEPIDRKSTRLNSSHLGISYAVFCLKKNNFIRVCMFSMMAPSIRNPFWEKISLIFSHRVNFFF